MINIFFRNPTSEEIATIIGFYDPLPYHNGFHALAVYARAIDIAGRHIGEGGDANLSLVKWSALFHDTRYAFKRPTGQSREEYSASIAERYLDSLGAPQEFSIKVREIIIDGTHRDGHFKTVEAQILRAADLHTFSGEYPEFFAATLALYLEECALTGKVISFEEWKKNTAKVAAFYQAQDIHLSSRYYDPRGSSKWHNNLERNLELFQNELL